eukprot:CAMPEP_0206012370 /NCGR_PEP_ID=MMETSP1464-20131121/14706_1 /ASSEMBLY_ACC=CAM_ASM_001124 /TAXON_ID=119497 /ORGANISM="Exanthemachrysis gayraliae, Strain RCC1523" /LENGTH=306 /DNA_ID=CAMNT_0053386051 /DNA_START=42 /DNA_END=958 /DNA_ORIENTATION=+
MQADLLSEMPPSRPGATPMAILCWVRTRADDASVPRKHRVVNFVDKTIVHIRDDPSSTFKAIKHQYSYPAPPHRVRLLLAQAHEVLSCIQCGTPMAYDEFERFCRPVDDERITLRAAGFIGAEVLVLQPISGPDNSTSLDFVANLSRQQARTAGRKELPPTAPQPTAAELKAEEERRSKLAMELISEEEEERQRSQRKKDKRKKKQQKQKEKKRATAQDWEDVDEESAAGHPGDDGPLGGVCAVAPASDDDDDASDSDSIDDLALLARMSRANRGQAGGAGGKGKAAQTRDHAGRDADANRIPAGR